MSSVLDSLSNSDLFLLKRTTIASYPGGKSDRKKHSPLYLSVPNKIDFLIEPFAGLANFFIVISPRVKKAWLNDLDIEIYSILQCIKDKSLLKELVSSLQDLYPIDRNEYYKWKNEVQNSTLNHAIKRIIILNCSPNGAGGGYSREKANRKWYFNKPMIWEKISDIFNNKSVKITNLDFKEVFEEIKNENRYEQEQLFRSESGGVVGCRAGHQGCGTSSSGRAANCNLCLWWHGPVGHAIFSDRLEPGRVLQTGSGQAPRGGCRHQIVSIF